MVDEITKKEFLDQMVAFCLAEKKFYDAQESYTDYHHHENTNTVTILQLPRESRKQLLRKGMLLLDKRLPEKEDG